MMTEDSEQPSPGMAYILSRVSTWRAILI